MNNREQRLQRDMKQYWAELQAVKVANGILDAALKALEHQRRQVKSS